MEEFFPFTLSFFLLIQRVFFPRLCCLSVFSLSAGDVLLQLILLTSGQRHNELTFLLFFYVMIVYVEYRRRKKESDDKEEEQEKEIWSGTDGML